MKIEKRLRETPFGGYRREDVLDYIKTADTQYKEDLSLAREEVKEASAERDEALKRIDSMTRELAIKTELAAQAEHEKHRADKAEKAHSALKTEADRLREENQTLRKELDDLRAAAISCEHAKNGICPRVEEESKRIVEQASRNANEIIEAAKEKARIVLSDADEQAAGIVLSARLQANETTDRIREETDAVASELERQSHEIIESTVAEARKILDGAQKQRDGILDTSAQSLGKIKGNLSSIQMVVRNIENELRTARESLNLPVSKKD